MTTQTATTAPVFDPHRIKQANDALRKRREAGIDALAAEAAKKGEPTDRTYLGMKYDFEHAPETTNRKQLAERGIVIPDPSEVSDEDLPAAIMRAASALSLVGVYFTHTDHLDDRAMYTRLCTQILDETVRENPPGDVCAEFVDMVGTGAQAVEVHFSTYATDAEREKASAQGVPMPPKRERVADRDRTFPKPPQMAKGGA